MTSLNYACKNLNNDAVQTVGNTHHSLFLTLVQNKIKLFTVCNLHHCSYEPWTCTTLLSWILLSFIFTSVFWSCLYCFRQVDFNTQVRELLFIYLFILKETYHEYRESLTASLSHAEWRSSTLLSVGPECGGMWRLMRLLLMVQMVQIFFSSFQQLQVLVKVRLV